MKNLGKLALASLLVFNLSCSKSDDDVQVPQIVDENTVLPINIKENDAEDPQNINIIYEGNKIKESNGNQTGKTTYTYTGDLITKETSVNNGITEVREYVYNNQKQLETVRYLENDVLKELYRLTYPTANTIVVKEYSVNKDTKVESLREISNIKLDAKGNVIEKEMLSSENMLLGTQYFKYDDKKHPLYNVTGVKYTGLIFGESSVNNIIERSYITSSNDEKRISYTVKITYNKYGFPTIIEETYPEEDNNALYKTEYTYNK